MFNIWNMYVILRNFLPYIYILLCLGEQNWIAWRGPYTWKLMCTLTVLTLDLFSIPAFVLINSKDFIISWIIESEFLCMDKSNLRKPDAENNCSFHVQKILDNSLLRRIKTAISNSNNYKMVSNIYNHRI